MAAVMAAYFLQLARHQSWQPTSSACMAAFMASVMAAYFFSLHDPVKAAYLFSLHGSSHCFSSHGSIPLQLAWQQSWQHRWLTEHHAGPLPVQPFLPEADLPTQDPADERLSGDCCCCSTSECTAGRPSTDPRCPALTALSADQQCPAMPAISAGLHWLVLTVLSANRHCPEVGALSACCRLLGRRLFLVLCSLGCGAD